MSGIAGVVHPDNEQAAIARALALMLGTMRHRFPDGECTQLETGLGLGALDAVLEPGHGHSASANKWIASCDGDWLLFDGRLDARDALRASLRQAMPDAALDAATDAKLALLAYRCWGEDAFDRLDGDFAIAIRDGARERFVLARDRFGVRPLFYARKGERLAWASDTQALLALPWVERRENEQALLDFLMFGYAADPWASSFAGVVQVAPGHVVTITPDAERRRSYWTPRPVNVVGSGMDDFAEQFLLLLDQAVGDRMSVGTVGVLLSGGLDSTSVAAMAAPHARKLGGNLHGFTVTSSTLWPGDAEGEFAQSAASQCGFATQLVPMDDIRPFQDWAHCSPPSLAPINTPFLAVHRRVLERVSSGGIRLLLSGEGGDPCLETPAGHMRAIANQRGPFALMAEVVGAMRTRRSLRGIGLRSLLPNHRKPRTAAFPAWIRPETRRQWGLEERWHRIRNPEPRTAIREEALVEELQDNAWLQPALQQYEGAWGPMTVAHPYMDRRLVEFAMALPQYAAKDKLVMRHALRGHLPAAVLERPKAHVYFDYIRHWHGQGGWKLPDGHLDRVRQWIDPRLHDQCFQAYLHPDANTVPWDGLRLMLPVALNGWIENATRIGALTPVATN